MEHLLKLAKDGEPVQIDGTPIDPVALLTLFLKRSLGLLSQVTNTERIGALMITARNWIIGCWRCSQQAVEDFI